MALTVGTGPFGKQPAGSFNTAIESPTGSILYFDAVPQRIRGILGGETVVDSTRARLLHETGHLPVYYFPADDVRLDLLEPTAKSTHCPHKGDASYWTIRAGGREVADAVWGYREPLEPASFLRDHVAFSWDALDEWLAEDEQLFGHPRDPFHRIDVYDSSRHIRVSLDGETLADSTRARVLFENGLPPRWYLPPEDVRTDLLVPSEKTTTCAYKGHASYWHARVGDRLVEDIVWAYPEPAHDAEPVRGRLCFFDERVDVEIDGVRAGRPQTPWS
jgi:uncharacterized protein (DUF427 family)